MSAKAPRKLGRPPASSSADTRQRILDVARETFAERGWARTTNKLVADKAGVTSAALYHYFDSKLDMWLAVHDDAQRRVDTEFRAASATSDTFIGQFEAMLDTAGRMNEQDPSLAQFLGSSRVDVTRHPELHKAMRRRRTGDDIVGTLVDTGIRSGEIPTSRRDQAAAVVRVVFVGLTDGVSHELGQHRAAIDGIRSLLEGQLIERTGASGPGNDNGQKRSPARSAEN